MEIGNAAVQTLMAFDLAVTEFRRRIGEQIVLNSDQLSPLCHRPLDLHRFMEQFAQLMAHSLGVILVEGDPDRRRTAVEAFLEGTRMLLRLEISGNGSSAGR
jgi:hypothetical protein